MPFSPLRWRPRRLFYGWWLVIAGAVSNFLFTSIGAYGFGVFVGPVSTEMGWGVAVLSVGFSLRSLESGLFAPFTGYMVDRFGSRTMAILGVCLFCFGLALFSQVHTLWLFYGSLLVLAAGQSVGAATAFAPVIMRWFVKRRASAVGILNTGNGLGNFGIPILVFMIQLIGWRTTLLAAAGFVAAVGLPMAFMIRPRPEPYGYLPDGEAVDPAAASAMRAAGGVPRSAEEDAGYTVAQALRLPAFYLIAAANGLQSTAISSWLVHQVRHLENVGFAPAFVGAIAGAYGLYQLFLRVVIGWLSDRLGRRLVYTLSFAFLGLGLLFLAFVTREALWLLPGYLLLFGMGNGSSVVTQQTFIADYFGLRRFATIRGLTSIVGLPLGLLSPIAAGWVFDQTGSYRLFWIFDGFVVMCGSLLILMIRRPKQALEESRSV